jgi:cytosine/adenosine deaminase-related metal-dependent hydrolase
MNDGAVFQRDGRIVEVGPYRLLREKYRPEVILGSTRDVVIPGLINCHHHVGLTPFQLGVPDLPLELWGIARRGTRPVDPYLDTLYSAFELIQSGVTLVQHIQPRMSGPLERWPTHVDDVLRAYSDVGMRTSFSVNLRDQSRIVYGDDLEFIASLPRELGAEITQMLGTQTMTLEDQLQILFVDVKSRWTSERIRVQLAPANYHWLSDEGLVEVADYADRYDVGMHMHLLETPYQKVYASKRCGGSVVRRLGELGVLSDRLTLGHAVWVTPEDIETLLQTRVMVCHNASSNLRLRSGIAPIRDLVRLGVPVGIGIDEAGINDDRDMLQEMRLVLSLHGIPGHDAFVLTPSAIFDMATAVGAITTGFGSEVGSLAPNKSADIVLLDWDRLSYPYLDDSVPVIDAIVHRGRPSAVRTVIVGGEVIYHDGLFTRVDRGQILAAIQRTLDRAPTGGTRRDRKLFQAVMPYVKAYYSDWLDPVDPHDDSRS